MTHKEQFEHLKETDPIHYAEMMDDGMLSGDDNGNVGTFIGFVIIMIIIIGFLIFLIKNI